MLKNGGAIVTTWSDTVSGNQPVAATSLLDKRMTSSKLMKASTGRDPAPPKERGTSADLGAGRESVVLRSSLEEFERAIYPHLNSAYNLARWLLRSDQDAEDVVHDSFLRAHRYFESFDGSDGRAWLLGIVRNACFTWLRTKKTEPLPHDEASDWKSPIEASPERVLLLNEDLDALRHCIESLPAEYRAVIVMRELEEFSYKEIATAAGVALGTVMSRLNRARTRLENCLTGKSKAKESRS